MHALFLNLTPQANFDRLSKCVIFTLVSHSLFPTMDSGSYLSTEMALTGVNHNNLIGRTVFVGTSLFALSSGL